MKVGEGVEGMGRKGWGSKRCRVEGKEGREKVMSGRKVKEREREHHEKRKSARKGIAREKE